MGGVNFSREIYDGNNGKKTLSYLYTFLNPKPSFLKKKKKNPSHQTKHSEDKKWYIHDIFTTNLKWQVIIVELKKLSQC